MKVGIIYAYRDPTTYNWIYVGSVQNQFTLEKRHLRHLKDNSLFDTWLRFMESGGVGVLPEVMQYVGFEKVEELFDKENEWINSLETLRPKGLNLVLAGGIDHAIMGKIAHSKHPNLAAENGARFASYGYKGGIKVRDLHPDLAVKRGRRMHEIHPNLRYENARNIHKLYPLLAKECGYKSTHVRWHVSRGVINKNCKFCTETNVC